MRSDDARLEIVRSLCRSTIEFLAPAQLDSFESDFARGAIIPGKYQVHDRPAQPLPTPDKTLDTTLVAGMFFNVLLEAEGLPENPMERTRFVKRAVKNFLVQRLAGQITLPQFFRLLNLIEEKTQDYFENLRAQWLVPGTAPTQTGLGPELGAPTPMAPEPVRKAELRKKLMTVPLPHRANRKLTTDGLVSFLADTRGQWFRLSDFESHFRLNKKTAWVYLSLLLQHNILRHNQQKANRVRYALAPRFLVAESGLQGDKR